MCPCRRVPTARVSVALLVPDRLAGEVDGLRRALDDGALGRIRPHITLVPPVNVPEDRLAEALAVLRSAAAAVTQPLRLALGPVATFLPVNPVVYLQVGDGGAVERLRALRDAVFSEPLARPLTWPWVPHVTLAGEVEPARIDAALLALSGYRAIARFDRVDLLREGPGRVWEPVADAAFDVPAVVGRGGLPLELTVSDRLDPEAAALVLGAGRPFAVTACRDGQVVGSAVGTAGGTEAGEGVLWSIVVGEEQRRQGIGSHLVAAVVSLAADRGCTSIVAAGAPASVGELAGFLRRLGWVDDAGRLRRLLG